MIVFKKFIPGIAWFFLVLILICLPADNLPKPDDWMSKIYFDKWVHIGLFSILALLFMLPVARSLSISNRLQVLIKIVLAVSIWGMTTEIIQHFYVSGRSFDPWDWVADTVGALAAFLYVRKKYLKTENQNNAGDIS